MDAATAERLINENCEIQKRNHPDTQIAQDAVARNRVIFAECEANGWTYSTDKGVMRIYGA